jgi:hypothetical protein
VTDHAPLDVRDDNTDTHPLRRRALEFHILLSLNIVSWNRAWFRWISPRPRHHHPWTFTKSASSEKQAAKCHVVRVPSLLDLTDKVRNRFLIHPFHRTSQCAAPRGIPELNVRLRSWRRLIDDADSGRRRLTLFPHVAP